MNSLLTRLAKTFRVWFSQPQAGTRKKFQPGPVRRVEAPRVIRSGKRFEILNRTSRVIQAARNFGSRFNVGGLTRPRICPFCRSEGRVTRGQQRQWQCRECNFEWGA